VKHIITLSLFFIGIMITAAASNATASTPVQNYNDVLVVINSNSTVSEDIGAYFASQRGIPTANIVRIAVPTTEEISDAQFVDLRTQLEALIVSRGLANTINYIVTTKGMPLKVKRSNANANASVESELTLILGPYAANIGRYSRINSPYYGIRADFSHGAYGIYLVTRLDGYTSGDVHGMIDRAATIPSAVPAGAKFVLDEDPSWNATAGQLNTNMANASTLLAQKGLSVALNTTTTYVTNQTGVMGYASWGSNDYNWSSVTTNAKQNNSYLPGAIGETYVSTDARSFTSPMTYGQSAIADMIAEGITGVKGYVYEPYTSSMSDVSKLFPMYADGYSLAESFYSASPYLSWMDVVIGDPKCRMINTRYSSGGTAPLPSPSGSLTGSVTSLPSTGGSVTLTWASSNATAATIDQGIGTVALNGSTTVTVTSTKTFTLTVANSTGATAAYTVTVTVAPPVAAVTVISSFIAGPTTAKGVLLSWTTSTEANNTGFDIQRKKGTGSYGKIGYVAGKGSSAVPVNYQYNDGITKNGTYTYRLRQINTDGTSAYSPEVSVQISRNVVTTLTSYPNPFNPTTNISFTVEQSGHATMKVYNVIGQEVATLFNGDLEAGVEHTVTFNATSLASGLYFSVLETGGQRFIQKMLLSK
jgi:uncharacterized protein (TIGR03790 family)